MFTLTIEDSQGGIADEYSFEEGEFIIGRSHSADIILPSDNVSRRHSRLYTVDGRAYVEDLNSSNGVFVNGRRIHEVHQIQGSAQIKVGDYFLHIEGGPSASAEETLYCRFVGLNLCVAEQVFRIQRTVSLVGRGKDCSITIIDPSVSRIHSKLTAERSGAVSVEDLKSSNGTFVNGVRVEVATLKHHDVVRFGNVELRAEFPDLVPGDAAPGDAASSTTDDLAADEDWDQRPSRRGLWMALSVVAGVLVLGGILTIIFGDQIFGGSNAPAMSAAQGSAGGDADASASASAAAAAAAAEEAERSAEEELKRLVKQGAEQMAARTWDKALETWEKVFQLDPVNSRGSDAQRAINQIKTGRTHGRWVASAREAAQRREFAKALKVLRDIDQTSPYYADAQEEINNLLKRKPALVIEADALAATKSCEGQQTALRLYQQAVQLDVQDATLLEKVKKTERMVKRRCR